MADKTMLFGTEQYIQRVQAPATGMGRNLAQWRDVRTFLNGGAALRQSMMGHMEYSMSWGPFSQDEADKLMNFFNGLYGPGPYYFLDPFAMDKNVLPQYIAAPFVGASDGFSMANPSVVANPSPVAVNGHPMGAAGYTLSATSYSIFFRGLVPAGYKVLVGSFGSVTGTAKMQVGVGFTPSTWVDVPVTTDPNVRFTGSVTNATGADAFFALRWHGGASGGTVTARSLQAIVVPSTATTPTGAFVSGKGSSGIALSSSPQVTGYSAVIPNANVAVSADFIEIGSWA